MRRAYLAIIIAFFYLILTPTQMRILAQETVIQTETPIGVEVATESSEVIDTRVNYELPYPGMLPDHPFYFMKVIRDRVVKFLINDDLKLAKFDLLNAEKRIFAGRLLVDKGKDELAVATISKSNNYLDESIDSIVRYKKAHPKSIDILPFVSELNLAIEKHIEIIKDVTKSIDKKYLDQIKSEQGRLQKSEQSAKGLLLQK